MIALAGRYSKVQIYELPRTRRRKTRFPALFLVLCAILFMTICQTVQINRLVEDTRSLAAECRLMAQEHNRITERLATDPTPLTFPFAPPRQIVSSPTACRGVFCYFT